jgi:hypothetical protein
MAREAETPQARFGQPRQATARGARLEFTYLSAHSDLAKNTIAALAGSFGWPLLPVSSLQSRLRFRLKSPILRYNLTERLQATQATSASITTQGDFPTRNSRQKSSNESCITISLLRNWRQRASQLPWFSNWAGISKKRLSSDQRYVQVRN